MDRAVKLLDDRIKKLRVDLDDLKRYTRSLETTRQTRIKNEEIDELQEAIKVLNYVTKKGDINA